MLFNQLVYLRLAIAFNLRVVLLQEFSEGAKFLRYRILVESELENFGRQSILNVYSCHNRLGLNHRLNDIQIRLVVEGLRAQERTPILNLLGDLPFLNPIDCAHFSLLEVTSLFENIRKSPLLLHCWHILPAIAPNKLTHVVFFLCAQHLVHRGMNVLLAAVLTESRTYLQRII